MRNAPCCHPHIDSIDLELDVRMTMNSKQSRSIRAAAVPAADVPVEEYFLVAELTRVIPWQPSVQTPWRWILAGILDRSGQRVRLASTKIGGRRVVSRADLDKFIARLNTDNGPSNRPSRGQDSEESVTSDESRARQAGHALDAMGCGPSKKGRRR